MIQSQNDQVIIPKESAIFGYYNKDDHLVEMKDQLLYKHDWIGLKKLNETKRLHTMRFNGWHTQVTEDIVRFVINPYIIKNPEGWEDHE
jgi:palmitoyl-protein thioesterase